MKIRKAEKKDMNSIHSLVKELAIFENEPEAVLVNTEYYEKCFDEKIFQAIVAEEEGEIIGMALFYMCFSTWKGKMMYLEDFVIQERFRNKGVGQLIWDELLDESKKQEAKLLKWQVLDWNINAIKFYEKNNAQIEKEWWNGKIIFY